MPLVIAVVAFAVLILVGKEANKRSKQNSDYYRKETRKTNIHLQMRLIQKYQDEGATEIESKKKAFEELTKLGFDPSVDGKQSDLVVQRRIATAHLGLPLTDENVYAGWSGSRLELSACIKFNRTMAYLKPVGTIIELEVYKEPCEIIAHRFKKRWFSRYPKVCYNLKGIKSGGVVKHFPADEQDPFYNKHDPIRDCPELYCLSMGFVCTLFIFLIVALSI